MLSVSSPETQKSLQQIRVYRLSREVKLPKMSFGLLTLACESKSLQQILVHRLNREVVLSSSKFWFTGLAGKSYYLK